jgi:hypothetical protein
MGMGGQRHAPAALPPGKTQYPLCTRLGGPQGRSGRLRKISSAPGFDPRAFQPVASRYTDWAIPAPSLYIKTIIIYRSSDVITLDNSNQIVLNTKQCEVDDGRPNTSSPFLHPTLAQMKATVNNLDLCLTVHHQCR